jgi:iron complex outermembrane receptor protein
MNTDKEAPIPYVSKLFRHSRTNGVKLSAKKEFNENHLFSFSTAYSKMDISNGVRKYNAGTNSWNPWMSAFGITGGDIKTLALKLSDDFTYGKAFYALSASYENVKRDVQSNVNTSALSHLVPVALLDTIVKTDTHANDNLFSLSAKAGYELSPAFIPYIKISNSERTPYFNEAFGNNPNNGSSVPNQTLENEKVWGMDIGFDGNYNSFYYTSALYYQQYKDYIELVQTGYYTTTPAHLPIKRYVNLDKAFIYGTELMGGYTFGNDLFAEVSYLYTYGQNKDDNTPLAFIAPQKLTLSLSKRKASGVSWKIEEVFVDNQNRISSVNGEVATSGYALTNASVSYRISNFGVFKDATFSIELENIFDKTYREHLDKVSSTAWYLPNNPGINGVMSFKATF